MTVAGLHDVSDVLSIVIRFVCRGGGGLCFYDPGAASTNFFLIPALLGITLGLCEFSDFLAEYEKMETVVPSSGGISAYRLL